ncbi:hypothetical protein F2P81_015629 [Scophthalmus maximus]|uniref:Uncharacterized protein n=1 Tax=Scophthalmus maximus TaxID=52904 RepID=A0A6A4SJC1_SCOMX|nr:hypothetical protein F2P81_015629 [Scophthalmus maximus]
MWPVFQTRVKAYVKPPGRGRREDTYVRFMIKRRRLRALHHQEKTHTCSSSSREDTYVLFIIKRRHIRALHHQEKTHTCSSSSREDTYVRFILFLHSA